MLCLLRIVYFPSCGQTAVTGVVPSLPWYDTRPYALIAPRVQDSHRSSHFASKHLATLAAWNRQRAKQPLDTKCNNPKLQQARINMVRRGVVRSPWSWTRRSCCLLGRSPQCCTCTGQCTHRCRRCIQTRIPKPPPHQAATKRCQTGKEDK